MLQYCQYMHLIMAMSESLDMAELLSVCKRKCPSTSDNCMSKKRQLKCFFHGKQSGSVAYTSGF